MTNFLGRPLTFGDVEQINALKRFQEEADLLEKAEKEELPTTNIIKDSQIKYRFTCNSCKLESDFDDEDMAFLSITKQLDKFTVCRGCNAVFTNI